MLVLLYRRQIPDAAYWPGRRWLAVMDALAWPLMWLVGLTAVEIATGLLGWVMAAVALFSAAARCRRAIWLNHRYRFTSWRWGRALVTVLGFGIAVRLMQSF